MHCELCHQTILEEDLIKIETLLDNTEYNPLHDNVRVICIDCTDKKFWELIEYDHGERHIIPANDIIKHTEDMFCQCNPTVEVQEDEYLLVIHNAYDGRE